MRMTIALMIWMLAVAGCSATPPVSGNANGGLIDLSLAYSNDRVLEAAEKHCQQYGKTARLTKGRSLQDHNGTFECV